MMQHCNISNEDWIGYLYDELDKARQETLAAHLASCADCREQVETLQGTRQFMQDHAQNVPLAPRLVVLRPRTRPSFWTFAAGLAAATIVFSLGLSIGMRGGQDNPLPTPEYLTRAELDTAVERALAERRETPGLTTDPAYMTQGDIQAALSNLQVAFDQRSQSDFNFIMDEISLIETRGVNERALNRKLMSVLMVDRNPRLQDQ